MKLRYILILLIFTITSCEKENIFTAVKNNDYNAVLKQINSGTDPNIKYKQIYKSSDENADSTPLYFALGSKNIIELLLDKGAIVTDDFFIFILKSSLQENEKVQLIELIFRHKKNIETADYKKEVEIINNIIKLKSCDIIEIFSRNGYNIRTYKDVKINGRIFKNYLDYAILDFTKGNLDFVFFNCIKNYFSINDLINSVQVNLSEIDKKGFKLLLDIFKLYDIKLGTKYDNNENTLLHTATKEANDIFFSVFDEMIYKDDLKIKNKFGNTALLNIQQTSNKVIDEKTFLCLKYLIDKGAYIAQRNNEGENILDILENFKDNNGNLYKITNYIKDLLPKPPIIENIHEEFSQDPFDIFNGLAIQIIRRRQIRKAADYNNRYLRNFFIKIAANQQGSFNLGQICDIYDYIYENWNYVSDPHVFFDYFEKASVTLANGMNGDCDDFAILMGSAMMSVGGNSRFIMARDATSGHAYAQVYVGRDYVKISKYIKTRYDKTEDPVVEYSHGGYWLNLDWQDSWPGARLWYSTERYAYYGLNKLVEKL